VPVTRERRDYISLALLHLDLPIPGHAHAHRTFSHDHSHDGLWAGLKALSLEVSTTGVVVALTHQLSLCSDRSVLCMDGGMKRQFFFGLGRVMLMAFVFRATPTTETRSHDKSSTHTLDNTNPAACISRFQVRKNLTTFSFSICIYFDGLLQQATQ
jgi:hypothetical protein